MRLTGIRWSRRATGIGAGVAATTMAAGAAVVALAFGADGVDEASAAEEAPTATLRTVEFPAVAAAARPEATIPSRDTERFSLVGVSWRDPAAHLDGTIKIRTRAAGSGVWRGWQELDSHGHGGPEGTAARAGGRLRGSTDPLWVGPSDGVEVRVTSAAGGTSEKLPDGLRLELVDPGESSGRKAGAAGTGQRAGTGLRPVANVRQVAAEPTPADPAPAGEPTGEPTGEPATSDPTPGTPPAATPTSQPTPSTPAPATTATRASAAAESVPRPNMVTRAGWGANEAITRPAEYRKEVKAVFVHHTAGSNTYNCSESASIIRAIQTYHVQTNGWEDIGYNFLVDKCGTLFEGHAGGIDKPVLGAHTLGFNTDTTGIAVLGTYIDAGVNTAVQDAIASLAAYKLGLYGYDPAGKVMMTAGLSNGKFNQGDRVEMFRISGHRDGYATECPGEALYRQLPTIRTRAAGVSGLTLTGLTPTTRSGKVHYTTGNVTASWSVNTPSSLMSRFELLIDGKVAATTRATDRTAAVTVPDGQHTVQVRGVHLRGATATTAAQTVVVETAAPRFVRRPQLRMRTGTVTATAVPATLTWYATDNIALDSVALTAPSARTFSPKALSVSTTVKPGAASTWSMTAKDLAGNTASASTAWTPVLVSEAAATRTGTWSTATGSGYLDGSALTSTAANASLTWSFTGRSASFIASNVSGSGRVHLYVDGEQVDTLDLGSSTAGHRQAVWTIDWATSAAHTIKIVVAGTSGRPRVTTDGIAYIR
ncbi:N-acetylmuramoyl-L-alanine amidase [Micromonospora pattaloongensis]|uniref:N-acetylmuramoyl-L-alanine amidase n=1 Tax=Micromonospora pattaloongensis TaxID=405436 RepID=A0A1H3HJW2_9ACTN|nr:N-acetylmuramoyl-L-alanine amidase [Micromonospora pattaloongensis]SDY15505.1 N-acetylmuramoyl-L-alanine amidase [Micromonospora pattaloongensis]